MAAKEVARLKVVYHEDSKLSREQFCGSSYMSAITTSIIHDTSTPESLCPSSNVCHRSFTVSCEGELGGTVSK